MSLSVPRLGYKDISTFSRKDKDMSCGYTVTNKCNKIILFVIQMNHQTSFQLSKLMFYQNVNQKLVDYIPSSKKKKIYLIFDAVPRQKTSSLIVTT